MTEEHARNALISRVWVSFCVAALVFTIGIAAYESVWGEPSPMYTYVGFLLATVLFTSPLLVAAGVVTYFFFIKILKYPLAWSSAAALVGGAVGYIVISLEFGLLALAYASIASAFFCLWQRFAPIIL